MELCVRRALSGSTSFHICFLLQKAVAPMPVPAGNRVGFVSPSGAFIVHISDLCRQRFNLSFPDLMPRRWIG